MSKDILRVKNVSKEFNLGKNQKLIAVNDVSLNIKAGERLAIVGESGCGKSTLAKVITHIEKPTKGDIFFDDKCVSKLNSKELREYRKDIQMIFQHPSAVFSSRMKIGTFLMEPWINFENKSKKEAREQAFNALERVCLSEDYFNKYPHQLSGGELQRVCIARALALNPKLLICDEATSALDVSIQKEIIDLLKEQQQKTGFAIMFICHNLALVENFCDTVAVMYLGKIVEKMGAKELLKRAKHPYSKALLSSVFNIHSQQNKKLEILEGEPPSPINPPSGCAFNSRCKYALDCCKDKCPELLCCADEHYVACFNPDE